MPGKIRVLVVEDSFLMREMIGDIVSSDPELELIDKARNGKEALEKIFSLHPDIVTLDINIPEPNGLKVLEETMKKQPTRVIMLSAYTQQGAAYTMRALGLGAIDFIPKPSGEVSLDISRLRDQIISKIKLAAQIDLEHFLITLKPPALRPKAVEAPPVKFKKLVVIGASTGGPRAILQVMHDIPRDLPAAFLIVQHMPEGFTLSFAERISWESSVKSKEAQEGDILSAGKAYVAPAGYHMLLENRSLTNEKELRVRLNQEPPVNFVRPSVSVTMESAAENFSPDVIAVILTGMGKDGLEGARKIKANGGIIIAQDEATSIVFGMPKVAIDDKIVDKVLPVDKIAQAIIQEIERG